MEECELCGRTTKDVYVIDVENVELRACARCAQGKKVLRIEKEKPQRIERTFKAQRKKPDEEMRLIENYGHAIREARERMKIPLKVLAEMINEKEPFLRRIEEQETEPTIKLTKKLEKVLNIKLTEEPSEDSNNFKGSGRSDKATIGDFVS